MQSGFVRFWLLLGTLALSSCHKGERAGGSPPAASVHAPLQPTIDLTPGDPTKPGRFASDRLWRRARAGEPHELAVLAGREGASGLLEGLETGRSIGLTALGALPYATDAELALGRLCEIVEQEPSDPPRVVLKAVHGIVARPPTQTEELDNTGYVECLAVMKKLDKPGLLKGARHDLVRGCIEMIEEHRDAAKH